MGRDTYHELRQHLNGSLERLQTDYVDVCYVHRTCGVAIEEVAFAMGQLIDEGLIRGWGLSQVDVDVIDRAQCVTHPEHLLHGGARLRASRHPLLPGARHRLRAVVILIAVLRHPSIRRYSTMRRRLLAGVIAVAVMPYLSSLVLLQQAVSVDTPLDAVMAVGCAAILVPVVASVAVAAATTKGNPVDMLAERS